MPKLTRIVFQPIEKPRIMSTLSTTFRYGVFGAPGRLKCAWTVPRKPPQKDNCLPERQLLANNRCFCVLACSLAEFQRACQEKVLAIRGVGAVGPGTGGRMTHGETEALYERALQGFAQIAEKSVNDANNNIGRGLLPSFRSSYPGTLTG
jgi:hypothetical protein